MKEIGAGTTSVDIESLRQTLGCFASGIGVATTIGNDGRPVGLTINSFSSVSLDPPLVLWCLALTAPSISAFRSNGAFAVNILAREQSDLCFKFARHGADKFENVDWALGLLSVPVISEAHAHIECRVWRRYEGGDHEIIIGEVKAVKAADKRPLLYHRGQVGGFVGHPTHIPRSRDDNPVERSSACQASTRR